MKITKLVKVKQLLLPIPPRKPKYVQQTFRFPKTNKKLDKLV